MSTQGGTAAENQTVYTSETMTRETWLGAAETLLRLKPRLLRRDYQGNDRAYLIDRARVEADLRAGLLLLDEIRAEQRITVEDLETARRLTMDGRVQWVEQGEPVLLYRPGAAEWFLLDYRSAVCCVLGRAWWSWALRLRLDRGKLIRFAAGKFGADVVGRLMIR